MRPDQHRAHAPEENGVCDRRDLRLLHAVAEQHEGIGAHLVRRQVIRLVEIDVIDLVAGDEGIDLQRLVAVGDGSRDFVRFKNDVLAVFDLVAFNLVVALDGIARLAVDELAFHPIAGLAVQRVEGDAFRRGCRCVERHRTGDLSELDETLPIRTRGNHDAGS